MNTLGPVFFIFNSLFIFLGCSFNDTTNNSTIEQTGGGLISKESKFKMWISDTIECLKKLDSNYLQYQVYNDSLSLDVYMKYRLNINPQYIDTMTMDDIIVILDIMKNDEIMPQESFIMNFEIIHNYDVSINEDLYDYNYEIKNLELIYGNKRYKIKYSHGNLIEKTELSL